MMIKMRRLIESKKLVFFRDGGLMKFKKKIRKIGASESLMRAGGFSFSDEF